MRGFMMASGAMFFLAGGCFDPEPLEGLDGDADAGSDGRDAVEVGPDEVDDGPPAPITCGLSEARWHDVLTLHDVSSELVRDLGGSEAEWIARAFVGRLLSSQPGFHCAALAQVALPGLPAWDEGLVQEPDGGWVMHRSSPRRELSLRVNFKDGDTVLLQDPRRLDAYFLGAEVTSLLGAEDMVADKNRKNTYRLRWDEPGPLAHLLAGDPSQRELTISLSYWDCIEIMSIGIAPDDVTLDLGPLRALTGIVMHTEGGVGSTYAGGTLGYTFAMSPMTIGELVAGHSVEVALRGLGGRYLDLTLVAPDTRVRYTPPCIFGCEAALDGRLELAIEGPGVVVGAVLSLEGDAWDTAWHCPD